LHKAFHDPLQLRRAWSAEDGALAAPEVRDGQLKHGGRANVGHLPELGHEFQDVDEPGEARVEQATGAVG
jgi:hypothetical protein